MYEPLTNLRSTVREIFDETVRSVDAGKAVRDAVAVEHNKLRVVENNYDLDEFPFVYSIAVGKAAVSMAEALTNILGQKLKSGVISCLRTETKLTDKWHIFNGGHPLPNEESFASARAAQRLLKDANKTNALVIFLISGGGSAVMDLPRDESVSLENMREASRVLVTCGATIAEINAVRRRLSAIKGGGLISILEPNIKHVSLIISDTNRGDESNVASGPTFPTKPEDISSIVDKYNLKNKLPLNVLFALDEQLPLCPQHYSENAPYHYVLLDNDTAIESAVKAARSRGFEVLRISDLTEANVDEGCRELVKRLIEALRKKERVCLISGGEFVCPVLGNGTGGRNSEASLRCAIEFEKRAEELKTLNAHAVALHAGTDGIDGNSLAAGAIADETTVKRAVQIGLNPENYLARSDAFSFFNALNDLVVTGPSGTNARDVRLLLAVRDNLA